MKDASASKSIHVCTHKIVHLSAMHFQNLIIIHECSKMLLEMKNSKSFLTPSISRGAMSAGAGAGRSRVGLIFHYPKRLSIKNKEMYKEMRIDQNFFHA